MIDLIDCIVPGSIKYDLVKTCESDEVCVRGVPFSACLSKFYTGDGISQENDKCDEYQYYSGLSFQVPVATSVDDTSQTEMGK
mgnify:CR=1 FL=1